MNPTDPYLAATQTAALFDRSADSKIELAGPDARLFLHNLCTQDVKNLPEGAGCEAFLTTAKARVMAHGIVNHVRWQGQAALWFDTVPGQAERVLAHLNHFLISEQVELAERTRALAVLQLVGPAATTVLNTTFAAPLPALKPWQHVALTLDGNDVLVRSNVSVHLPAYDCFCAPALAPLLQKRLVQSDAVPAGNQAYESLRVEAGWPVYGIDMDENRFVVEVGRNAQAICYTKGCFLGQEPIVMARDRGQVNRTLAGVLCGAGPALTAGTKLYAGDAEVGQVTSSVVSPRLGQTIALAYLKRGSQAPGTALMIEPTSAGRQAVVCALPFA